ncbi:hypothetical protein C8Q80DRAFT_511544 [Daedaleopsis nitida]|nr:hypothetical protein C8Q80DRAFT_511544 [Daedaleopsis nitida]
MQSAGPILCDDVVRHMFEFLAPGRKPDSDSTEAKHRLICQKALAVASRTCRGWSKSALDVLWRLVDDPIHLLSLFPSFGMHGSTYRFSRLISDDEWSRFQQYSPRVRILNLARDADHGHAIHSSVWMVLAFQCQQSRPLLPFLHSILGFAISKSSSDGLAELALLRTSTIRHLELDMSTGSSKLPADVFSEAIQPMLMQLDTLHIKDDPHHHSHLVHTQHSKGIHYWELKQLRTLHVVDAISCTTSFAVSLMGLPHLSSLALKIIDVEVAAKDLHATHSFNALKDLTLGGCLEEFHAFMDSLSSRLPALQSLSLTVHEINEGTQEYILQQLHLLYAALDARPLSNFQITFQSYDMMMALSFFGDATGLLTPLHSKSWRPLRRLTFHFQSMFSHINDAELRAFVTACPELVAFEFVHHPDVVNEMQEIGELPTFKDAPTLSTITAFTTAHPHLERLTLPFFDVHSIPPLAEVRAGHKLSWLDIVFLEPGPPIYAAALVLDRAYPNLELREHPGADFAVRGNELRLLLLGLQAGRRGTHRHL